MWRGGLWRWRKSLHVPSAKDEVEVFGDYRLTKGEYEDGETSFLSDY